MILRLQHERPDGEVDNYFLKPGRRYHIGRGSGCEIRILDLKLSRKHCALEFDGTHWVVVDLLSTNGCTLNGEQIVGTIPVTVEHKIAAGATELTIAEIFDANTAPVKATQIVPNESAGEADTEALIPEGGTDNTPMVDIEQEPIPEGEADQAAQTEANARNEWEPEPGSEALTKTDALVPHPGVKIRTDSNAKSSGSGTSKAIRKPTAVFRAEESQLDDDQDSLPTQTHTAPAAPTPVVVQGAPSSPPPGGDSEERTFFITVLGRRVGPLTRSAARDLKARELKGTLTTADLEEYPKG